jgi:hypothetical protein
MGLFASGTVCIVIIIEPFISAADPHPAIALPIMKTTEDGAAPHTTEPTNYQRSGHFEVYVWRCFSPISKINIAERKTAFGE